MGNPTANALPACQIAKVARLVSELQKTTEAGKEAVPDIDNSGGAYRVWIDPLLCPIEAEGKKLALQRIPDVYRNATHVLVLDASLMQYSVGDLSPEEVLLRIFNSSAWMRRLWTLQGKLSFSVAFPVQPGLCVLSNATRGCTRTVALFSVRRPCSHANRRNDQAVHEGHSRCTIHAYLAGYCHGACSPPWLVPVHRR